MISRRASPSASTIRIAPAALLVPVVRIGADGPRSGSPVAGPVTWVGLLHER